MKYKRLLQCFVITWITNAVYVTARTCTYEGRTFRNGEVIVELRNDNLLYKCLCTVNPPIFTGINCNASAEDAHVFVADNNQIVKIAIGDVYGFRKNYIRDLPGQAVSVDININKDYIYWSDVSQSGRGIYRAGFSDGRRITRIISEDIYEPNGVAVDWLSNNIYWTDAQLGAIFVAKDNGRDRVLLIGGLKEPRGLVVLPRNGLMFWTDQREGTINRARMDGSNYQVIFTALQLPNELTVDSFGRTIYWMDGGRQRIESCDFDGMNFKSIYNFKIDYNNPGYGLAFFNGRLYFSIWGQTSLFSINAQGGGDKRIVVGSMSRRAMGVGVVNAQMQRNTRFTNQCWTNSRGGCSHLCLPTSHNTHTCACPSNTGLVLARDLTNCVVPDKFLLSTSIDEGTVTLTSLDPGSPRHPVVLAQAHQPSSVDFDPIGRMVYWSDVGINGIYRKALNSSAPELFIEDGIGTVDGLAIDWENHHLYFTNTGWTDLGFPHAGSTTRGSPYHRIEMVDLRDRKKRKILTSRGLDRPRDLVVDTSTGLLYVSDWGKSPKVVQFDMDGQHPRKLQVEVENPNGLALHNGVLYITDSRYKSSHTNTNGTRVYHRQPAITSYNMVTNTATELLDITMEVPFGLAYHQGSLFFADWGLGGIYEVALGSSGAGERGSPFLVGVKKPTGVKFATSNVQRSRAIQSVCSPQRTQCSDVCTPVDGGYNSCLCPDSSASVLSENNWNCVEPDQFLLVADGKRIVMKSIQPPDHHHYSVVRTFDEFSNIVAVTFDPVSKFVYWADNGRQRISRKSLSDVNAVASGIEVVHTNIGQVEGLALDPDNQLLYWTDREFGSIEILSLVGMIHTTVLLGLESPRSIVLDPAHGMMYWTEGGVRPKVLSSRMNGQDTRVMLEEGLTWPNGLFHDPTSGLVYVADGGRLFVRSVPSEGQTRMERFDLNGTAGHLFGLGKLDGTLYFTDWRNRSLLSLNYHQTDIVIQDLIRPSQIHVQGTYSIRGSSSVCASRITRCSHICIPDHDSSICYCPVGKILADDLHSCVTEEELRLMTSTTTVVTTTTGSNTTTPAWADIITTAGTTAATTTEALVPVFHFNQETTTSATNGTTTIIVTTATTVPTTQEQTTLPALPQFENCHENSNYQIPIPEDTPFVVISPSTFNFTARDAIGRKLLVSLVDVTNENVDSLQLTTSQYPIVLRAHDNFNQSVECRINLLVRDNTRPHLTTPCPSDIMVEFYPGQMSAYVTWTPPQFSDNSGNPPTVSSTQNPGYFRKGFHNVTYTAMDIAGNFRSCSFSVVVNEIAPKCGSPFKPHHTQFTCATNERGIQSCQISCMDDYRLTLGDPKVVCYYNSVTKQSEWMPYLDNNVCKRADVGNVRQDVGVQYPSPCRASAEFYDSASHELASSLTRYRGCRNSTLILGLCTNARSKLHISCLEEQQLNVTVTVDLANARLAGSTSEARRVIRSASTDIIDMMSDGEVTTTGFDARVYTARLETISLSNAKIICGEGYKVVDDGCVQCPAGTYLNENRCDFCPIHFYQNLPGQLSCIECSPIKGTYFYGTSSVQYCVEMDRSGRTSAPLPIRIIIGGSVGGLLLLLAMLIAVCFFLRRRANNRIKKEQEMRRKQAEEAKAKKQAERKSRNESTNQRRRSGAKRKEGGERRQRIRSLDSEISGKSQQSRGTSGRGTPVREVPTASVPAMPRSGGNPQSVADTISHMEIMSESSKPDDGRSTGAESAIFTDAESVVSTETPLKSALKKSSRAPPVPRSYLEDDESTVISSSTFQPNELKQFKQRRFSLDGTLDDSHGRGNPNKRSVSMRKPVPTSRDLGPKMAAGRPTHIRRSNSLDRTPGPRGPLFNPNQPRMRMPRPMGPRGQFTPPGVIPHPGPMYGAFPPPRMAPRYPPHMQHRFATMHPGQPRYGRYWNDGMAPDSDWDSHSLRSEVDMMQQPPIMTMRGMRPRFRMDGMRVQRPPNMGISRFNRPAPPPYYSLQR